MTAKTAATAKGVCNNCSNWKFKMVIPQTMTLNFQSGIAEDTLLFGSIIRADWDNAN